MYSSVNSIELLYYSGIVDIVVRVTYVLLPIVCVINAVRYNRHLYQFSGSMLETISKRG